MLRCSLPSYRWLGGLFAGIGSVALFLTLEPDLAAVRAADVGLRPPELEGGVGWINTDNPIRLKDLKGKVVLLDFWTLC